MALREFWDNVWRGAQEFASHVSIDTPRIEARGFEVEAIEAALRGSATWLTRNVVKGFDEEDFSFLPEARRGELAVWVATVREAASTINPLTPARPEVAAEALPWFAKIARVLEFDRYQDPEAYRLGKRIEQEIASYRPPELIDLRFRSGLDHTGDPALYVDAYLGGSASGSEEAFLAAAPRLREMLFTVARELDPDRWPYLAFRDVAEEAELVEAS